MDRYNWGEAVLQITCLHQLKLMGAIQGQSLVEYIAVIYLGGDQGMSNCNYSLLI